MQNQIQMVYYKSLEANSLFHHKFIVSLCSSAVAGMQNSIIGNLGKQIHWTFLNNNFMQWQKTMASK